MDASASLTQLLRQVRDGDKDALDNLLPAAYQELHRIADSYLRRERPGHTLQATALIHETYLRLIAQQQPDYRDRRHFFGVAAQLMRQILVDHARAPNAGRRGGGAPKVSLPEFAIEAIADPAASDPTLFLDLDDALHRLEDRDARKARVIDLRFFAGLTVEECADILGISVETVWRDLRMGQAWLRHELSRPPAA
jgi:RNA polymerase sigma factor (TIGR02999 family)